ncbi:MAG TPA: hypothetical protein VGM06_08950 [Polyangiaceae bacterium]|jgi:hypothetical protein
MSLALVQISTADFQLIYDHMTQHARARKHQNMHMRQTRTKNKRRILHYLHAMHVAGLNLIEGTISGPGVYWHYTLRAGKAQTHLTVSAHVSPPNEDRRIQRQFLKEIMDRIGDEQAGRKGFPRYATGQFYLRRRSPGTPATHPNCQVAIANGVLDQRFVSRLYGWNFELLHP